VVTLEQDKAKIKNIALIVNKIKKFLSKRWSCLALPCLEVV